MKDSYVPKRLIYLGNCNRNKLQLEDTKNKPPLYYAALSYCWGATEQNRFKTEKDTLAMRQQGFDISQLPKTLRDAVEVAYALGLDYLWVDALCIIQDSQEDKDKEISKMWQTYRNATVTISASRASHSDQGFLHKRDLESQLSNIWALPWETVDNQNNSIPGTVFCATEEAWLIKPDAIDSRAWTMQEHKLARRLLRFGSSQMVWTCAQSDKVDGGSDEREQLTQFCSVKEEQAYIEWLESVKTFTSRFISESRDRLPAFAAIAADYGKQLNMEPEQYAAGLWKPWLAIGLLWYVEDFQAEPTRPSLPTPLDAFPTWSWHMARSRVNWPDIQFRGDHDKLKLVITECRIELWKDHVKYGRVTGGTIKAVGALLKIRFRRTRPVYSTPNGSVASAPILIKWDNPDVPFDEELYCLRIRLVTQFGYEGIVLRGSGNGLFERVGYFEPDSHDTGQLIWLNHQSITIK
jgi:hypothetical protein